MAGEIITWLHLSDWHQAGADFNRKVVAEELFKDIRGRQDWGGDHLSDIDFAVFSGDLAQSAQSAQYSEAERGFLGEILGAIGIQRNRLIIVPGNHDLDRGQLEKLPEDFQKVLVSEEEVNKILTDQNLRKKLLSPFNAYQKYVSAYLDNERFSPYYNSWMFRSGNKFIGIIGLNSALFSARFKGPDNEVDDNNRIIVGEPQVRNALGKIKEADLRIAVMHHPFDWLVQTNRMNERQRIGNQLSVGCHFFLHGHVHMPGLNAMGGTAGACSMISAGASFAGREGGVETNGYNIVHLNFDSGKGLIYFRRYEDYPVPQYKPDNRGMNVDPFGKLEFDLPDDLIEHGYAPPPEAPRETAGEVPQNVASIDTGGGAYFGGNISVQGDFVGRDKVVNHDENQGKETLMNEHFRHRNKLFDALREHFNASDVRELAYKLRNNISYDNLSGMTLNEKMISLIEYSEKTRQYRDLVEMVIEQRPFLRDELTPIIE